MPVSTVKVSKKFQIAVPSAARAALNIDSGDELIVDVQDGILVLVPKPVNYTEALAGMGREIWEKLDSGQYIAGERQSWENSAKS